MSPERWDRVTEIFNQALELPEAERVGFVEEICVADLELQEQVLALLDQHRRAGGFLETQFLQLPLSEPTRAFTPNTVISERYRVVRLLGQGGMGEVYEVEDLDLGGVLALKTVRPEIAANEGSLARFRQEIQLARKVNHPNVCRVFDIARHADGEHSIVYFTMELLAGQTLAERIRSSGPIAPAEAFPLIRQMAHALSAAHLAGIIHRDFKPSNVILLHGDPEREAVVTDFGLARLSAQARDGSITETGLVVGTPAYMAPEQLIGEPLSPETDVYAFGLVVYEMLTGRLPFKDDSVSNSALRRLRDQPEPPSRYAPGLDPRWEAAILRCLEREPSRRFHSPLQVEEVLSAARRETPTRALAEHRMRRPRRGRIVTGLGVLVALVAAILVWKLSVDRQPLPSADARHWLEVGTNAIRDGVYWKATKELARALSIDESMPLAHARLAEAWTELDSPDKARDEMLQATAPGRGESRLRGAEKLQFEAIHLTLTRDFSQAVSKYERIVRVAADSEAHYSYVDLGEAYEKNAQPQKALAAYLRATQLAPASPAGFVRLGVLYRKSANRRDAESAFHTAESLYKDQSDTEGETEVEYELARAANKPSEARELLNTALARTSVSGNIHQRIRILLQLGAVAASDGDIEAAKKSATEAIQMARDNGVEVLAVRGLIELGNALFISRATGKAEEYFQEAFRTAHQFHADFQENAALLDLGSLYMKTNRPEQGLKNVRKAKSFFDAAGFLVESSRASSLLGRSERDDLHFASALKAFGEQLKLAEQSGEPAQIADALEETGAVYSAEEDYPGAVKSYGEALKIRRELGAKLDIAYAQVNLAEASAALGKYEDAFRLLKEEEQGGSGYSVPLDWAEWWMTQERFGDAISLCRKQASQVPQDEQTVVEMTRILGSCRVRTGDKVNGLRLCQTAAVLAQQKVSSELPATRLALAVAQQESGDAQAALKTTLELAPKFEVAGQRTSAWRGWLYAGLAAAETGDSASARDYAVRSRLQLEKIKAAWDGENYRSYTARNDIRTDLRKLKQLTEVSNEVGGH